MKPEKTQNFVTFYSPGTFFNEETTKPIASWDVELAAQMAHQITQRYGATPFAFDFSTRSRSNKDLDSHETRRSHRYFLGGDVLTSKDIEKLKDRDYSTLLSNMHCNGWTKVVRNQNSYLVFQPLGPTDEILNWHPKNNRT